MLGTDYARILRTIYALAQAMFICSILTCLPNLICFALSVFCLFGGLSCVCVLLIYSPLHIFSNLPLKHNILIDFWFHRALLDSFLNSTFGSLFSLQIRVIRTYKLPSDIAEE